MSAPDRRQLVGLVPATNAPALPRGAQIVADPHRATPNPILGELTSTCFSPTLGHPIGLALLAGGRARHGEVLHAVSPVADQSVRVRVTAPAFFDPSGELLRG
jgi:sarcosine oxidase, subunit alpha